MQKAVAGDIVSIAGLQNGLVGHTLNEPNFHVAIKTLPSDPPMMSISIGINSAPLQGKEGNKLTVGLIKDRLKVEAENDVALRIATDNSQGKKQGGNFI